MRTHVEFRSNKFPPYEGEEEEVNPKLWGKRLAEYLSEKLRAMGVQTGEIYSEDWGWKIPLPNDAFPIWIGCGHYEEYSDGYLVFIDPSKPIIRKFLKKIDTTAGVARVADALDRIFSSDPDIRALRWWSDDEKDGDGRRGQV
ncbi:MAG: hypothetical protein KCHDKBKB_02957 [Elusimicrobia bacterium]|nr:hypothetical protein [Elusimicrobiota bacterium]